MPLSNGANLGLLADGAAGDGHYTELMARWRGLDALVQCHLISRTTAAEPGSPSDGDTYIVPTSATGTHWSGKDGKIARYSGIISAWEFYTPKTGWTGYIVDTHEIVIWTGAAWTLFAIVASTGHSLTVGNAAAATTAVGALSHKVEVFDSAGASLGFMALYASIT